MMRIPAHETSVPDNSQNVGLDNSVGKMFFDEAWAYANLRIYFDVTKRSQIHYTHSTAGSANFPCFHWV